MYFQIGILTSTILALVYWAGYIYYRKLAWKTYQCMLDDNDKFTKLILDHVCDQFEPWTRPNIRAGFKARLSPPVSFNEYLADDVQSLIRYWPVYLAMSLLGLPTQSERGLKDEMESLERELYQFNESLDKVKADPTFGSVLASHFDCGLN